MIRKYSVGSDIGYGYINRRGEIHNSNIARINRINKFGHIYLNNGLIFDKNGSNRGASTYKLRLVQPDQIENTSIPDTKEWKNVDRALKIIGYITNQFTSRGEFPVTEELKESLFDQLAELES